MHKFWNICQHIKSVKYGTILFRSLWLLEAVIVCSTNHIHSVAINRLQIWSFDIVLWLIFSVTSWNKDENVWLYVWSYLTNEYYFISQSNTKAERVRFGNIIIWKESLFFSNQVNVASPLPLSYPNFVGNVIELNYRGNSYMKYWINFYPLGL